MDWKIEAFLAACPRNLAELHAICEALDRYIGILEDMVESYPEDHGLTATLAAAQQVLVRLARYRR